MERLRKTLILLLVAGIPAAAPPFFAAGPNLCFTAGSVTYQVVPGASSPDYRVGIADRAAQPDLRIQLVDGVETADFALVDDFGSVDGSACMSAGLVKTVQLVGEGSAADVTMSLSHEEADADLKLFVHSARFGHGDAAALFAAMRHYQYRDKLAAYR
jgi:hypothetical protein